MTVGRILTVDDSALVRAVVRTELGRAGHVVLEAADGQEGLDVLAREDVDVVLLDRVMPGLDGLEVLAAIRADPATRHLPVVFVTGASDPGEAAEGLRRGADDYVRKPFEPVELLARVRSALRTKRLQDELRARNGELERLASTDGLTGLFNRRFTEEQAERILAVQTQDGRPAGCVLLDIDAFKQINDTHGHQVGDAVLKEVARRLDGRRRAEDLLGRWGGEEFLVVCAVEDAAGVGALAAGLVAAVGSAEGAVAVTISAGWAAGTGVGLPELLRRADAALYRAKDLGGAVAVGPA